MILLLSISLLSQGAFGSPADAQESCKQIYYTYTACRAPVKFDGNFFEFPGSAPMKCTDGKELSFYDRLENMDIASMLMIPYQPGPTSLPEKRRNWDPGRLRAEPLFKA